MARVLLARNPEEIPRLTAERAAATSRRVENTHSQPAGAVAPGRRGTVKTLCPTSSATAIRDPYRHNAPVHGVSKSLNFAVIPKTDHRLRLPISFFLLIIFKVMRNPKDNTFCQLSVDVLSPKRGYIIVLVDAGEI